MERIQKNPIDYKKDRPKDQRINEFNEKVEQYKQELRKFESEQDKIYEGKKKGIVVKLQKELDQYTTYNESKKAEAKKDTNCSLYYRG